MGWLHAQIPPGAGGKFVSLKVLPFCLMPFFVLCSSFFICEALKAIDKVDDNGRQSGRGLREKKIAGGERRPWKSAQPLHLANPAFTLCVYVEVPPTPCY
jgi:hypothetical protein